MIAVTTALVELDNNCEYEPTVILPMERCLSEHGAKRIGQCY